MCLRNQNEKMEGSDQDTALLLAVTGTGMITRQSIDLSETDYRKIMTHAMLYIPILQRSHCSSIKYQSVHGLRPPERTSMIACLAYHD